jgi:hypothetical protein
MIVESLILAGATGTGFYLVFHKLPGPVRRFLLRHQLLTDFAACVLTYTLFAGTLLGLFAAAWVGMVVSVMLTLMNNPDTSAAIDRLAEKLRAWKNRMVELLATWAKEKEEQPKLRVVND